VLGRSATREGLIVNVDFHAISLSPAELAGTAARVERLGYDSLWASEVRHDPFVGLAAAAGHTDRLALRTGLAVAFARNPMTTAMLANDLQLLSRGRFTLGLGSQLKSHITRRYAMPWSHPAARMREYILAVRAIWDTFATGRPLRFRGEFYRHTLMPPLFNPGPHPYPDPPILLAGVGERMTEVAGEVADGLLAHIIGTRRYLREVTIPVLAKARQRAGKSLAGFEIHLTPIVVTGRTEEEFQTAVADAKEHLGFYASIPSYGAVLEMHGLTGLRDELYRLGAEGRADQFGSVIDDSVLDIFAVVGEPAAVARKLHDRFGDIATSLSFYQLSASTPEYWAPLLGELRRLAAAEPKAPDFAVAAG
jgi:probable F420-dependent oxidoreductase